MWQRIQTLFLFFAGIASIIAFITRRYMIVFAVLAGIISVLSFVTIFLYKNRKLQIRFCNALIVLIICSLAIYIISFLISISDSYPDEIIFSLQPGILRLLSHVISLFFIILAKIFIKKDEKKVRSWERIR